MTEFEKEKLRLLEEQNRLLRASAAALFQANEISALGSRSIWQRIADSYHKSCNSRPY